MPISEKLEMLKNMTGETDNGILLAYLSLARDKVLQRAFPFNNECKEVPEKYVTNQIEIAAYLLNKRGAEGETSHNENGISRSYESASVPDSMLASIVPFCEVI